MESVGEVKRKSKAGDKRFGRRYGYEFKARCVKLLLEEEYPLSFLSNEFDVSKDTIKRWVKAYQTSGEAGLRDKIVPVRNGRKIPGAVRRKIVEERYATLIEEMYRGIN